MKPETKKNVLKYYETIKGTDSKEGSELTDHGTRLVFRRINELIEV